MTSIGKARQKGEENMARTPDISGMKFNRLEVLYKAEERYHSSSLWVCRCDCGTIKKVTYSRLVHGTVKSCGCLIADSTRERHTTHGLTHHPLFITWGSMKKRCYNPNDKRYNRYGGRGIKICDEWLDFQTFYDWAIAHGYKKGLSIERKNVDGNYEPDNCCWITIQEQARNRSNTRWVEYKDKKYCASEFARMMGTTPNIMRNRLNHGLSGDEIAKEFGK